MTIGILGKKLGMSQVFTEDGTVIPVTVIRAGPCRVLQVKVKDLTELPEEHRKAVTNHGKRRGKLDRPRRADGYYAVQLGFDPRPARTTTRPEARHAAKAGAPDGQGFYFVREFRWDSAPTLKQGEDVTVEALKDVAKVDIAGISKGRGWTGTIKRWNMHRQPSSHGADKVHRKAGGTGRTYSQEGKGMPKGKRSAGHYGVDRVTVQGLPIVRIDAERNLILVKGAVPGANNGYLMLSRSCILDRKQGKKK